MPVVNYQNGYIYKLVNSVDDKIYVGSSAGPTKKRYWNHKTDAQRYPDRHVYQHLNSIEWHHVRIIVIEQYPCNNKQALLTREQFWIDRLKPELNKARAVGNDEVTKETNRKSHERRLAMKYICQCGGHTSLHDKAKHFKSKTHQFYESCDGLNSICV